MEYPIPSAPALVAGEQAVCAGRVPTVDEMTGWLRKAVDQKS
jgi:hypothetical protein